MPSDRCSRREFIGAAGSAIALGLAGCAEAPPSETTTRARDPQTTIALSEGDLIEDGGVQQLDADVDSRFAEVYRTVRNSVVQIRVLTGEGSIATGSGFVYDDIHLVTNEHVVSDARDIFIRYRSTGWREGTVVGTDVYSDLAVLRVDDRPPLADPLPLARTDPPVGTEVIAIGNPYGLSGTVSTGIVSGVDRTMEAPNNFSIPDAIQTDAPVNPGNSGGPLVDLQGRVVGVISAGGGDNIGLAISAPLTRRVVPRLIETGSYDHPYMGIGLQNVTPAVAAANDLPEATGVYVGRVVDGGPSDGVLQGSTGQERVYSQSVPVGGDVLTHLAGKPVPTRQELASVLALHTQPGEPADLRFWRDGSRQHGQIIVGVRPAP